MSFVPRGKKDFGFRMSDFGWIWSPLRSAADTLTFHESTRHPTSEIRNPSSLLGKICEASSVILSQVPVEQCVFNYLSFGKTIAYTEDR